MQILGRLFLNPLAKAYLLLKAPVTCRSSLQPFITFKEAKEIKYFD